ncbi:hypothetical protein E0K89_016495 [Aquicoccus sp. SCR17]|nr:hypothetical protein [Carideicomes alvinocaridis]
MLFALATILLASASSDKLAQESAKPGISGLALCRGRYEALADYVAAHGESAPDLAAFDARLAREIGTRIDAADNDDRQRLDRLAAANRDYGRARMATVIARASAGYEYREALRGFAAYHDALTDCERLFRAEGIDEVPPG